MLFVGGPWDGVTRRVEFARRLEVPVDLEEAQAALALQVDSIGEVIGAVDKIATAIYRLDRIGIRDREWYYYTLESMPVGEGITRLLLYYAPPCEPLHPIRVR